MDGLMVQLSELTAELEWLVDSLNRLDEWNSSGATAAIPRLEGEIAEVRRQMAEIRHSLIETEKAKALRAAVAAGEVD
jgi:hypothetical protein